MYATLSSLEEGKDKNIYTKKNSACKVNACHSVRGIVKLNLILQVQISSDRAESFIEGAHLPDVDCFITIQQ